MSLVITLEGAEELIGRALNEEAPDNCELHLYTSNTTPAASDTTATYTECSAAGYASATLTGGSWTVSSETDTATAEYAQQDFEITESVTCYGYYVTNAAESIVLWAERFGTAAVLGAGGGTISVTPQFTGTTAS
jgi:hypothetical protein